MPSVARRVLAKVPLAHPVYRAVVRRRIAVERWVLPALRRPGLAQGRILSYHAVGSPAWGSSDVSPRDFERHLQVAVDDGWSFATPAEVIADPTAKKLALTFDDGPTTLLTNALPVLRHHGVPATAFIVTGWADGRYHGAAGDVLDWSGVRALMAAGITLASHSVTHPDFSTLGVDDTWRELDQSRRRLLEMTGVETGEFAIPMGLARHWNATAAKLAAEAGYTRIYSQTTNFRPPGTIPRTFITRFDRPRIFRAALAGTFDNWVEWY